MIEWSDAMYDDSDTEENRLGCRRLACAVIARAIMDMQGGGGLSANYEHERDASLAFLVSSAHEWAKAREFWATLADMDPNVLAERSRELIQ